MLHDASANVFVTLDERMTMINTTITAHDSVAYLPCNKIPTCIGQHIHYYESVIHELLQNKPNTNMEVTPNVSVRNKDI